MMKQYLKLTKMDKELKYLCKQRDILQKEVEDRQRLLEADEDYQDELLEKRDKEEKEQEEKDLEILDLQEEIKAMRVEIIDLNKQINLIRDGQDKPQTIEE